MPPAGSIRALSAKAPPSSKSPRLRKSRCAFLPPLPSRNNMSDTEDHHKQQPWWKYVRDAQRLRDTLRQEHHGQLALEAQPKCTRCARSKEHLRCVLSLAPEQAGPRGCIHCAVDGNRCSLGESQDQALPPSGVPAVRGGRCRVDRVCIARTDACHNKPVTDPVPSRCYQRLEHKGALEAVGAAQGDYESGYLDLMRARKRAEWCGVAASSPDPRPPTLGPPAPRGRARHRRFTQG